MVTIKYREILKYLAIFLLTIIVLKVTKSFAAYLLIPIALMAIVKRKNEMLFFLMLSIAALTVSSSVLFEKNIHYFIAVRMVFALFTFVLILKTTSQQTPMFLKPFQLLYIYMFYIMLTSIQGWMPIISELKAVLFLMFIIAFIQAMTLAWNGELRFSLIRAIMLTIAVFFIFGSLAVYPFPSIGRSMYVNQMLGIMGYIDYNMLDKAEGLYSGISMHSQMLGPILALLNGFLLSDYLMNVKRRNKLYLALLAGVPVLIYMTSSRTAMGGYLVSILLCVFFYMQVRGIASSKKSAVFMKVVALGLIAAIVLIMTPHGREKASSFIRKNNENMSLNDAVLSSRMGAVESGLDNFHQAPIFGNGFQVSREMDEMHVRSLAQLLSAPIEKGVLPIMILEEGGAIGFLIFLVFTLTLISAMWKAGCYGFLTCYCTFLCLNSGEGIYFSITATGGMLWMACFAALLLDIERLKFKRKQIKEQALAARYSYW